jgi:hypothetical protein
MARGTGRRVLRAVPPSQRATHVMVWADFGYGANPAARSLRGADALLATHRDGKERLQSRARSQAGCALALGWKNVKWVRAIGT